MAEAPLASKALSRRLLLPSALGPAYLSLPFHSLLSFSPVYVSLTLLTSPKMKLKSICFKHIY